MLFQRLALKPPEIEEEVEKEKNRASFPAVAVGKDYPDV